MDGVARAHEFTDPISHGPSTWWSSSVADLRCDLCWATFDSPVALLEHEAQEDDRLYDVETDG